MKKKVLRIGSATIRYDNVPKGVEAPSFETFVISKTTKIILVREYVYRRNITLRQFEKRLFNDFQKGLAPEVEHLNKLGMHPILYLGLFSYDLAYLSLTIPQPTIHKLSLHGRSIEMNFPSEEMKDNLIISLSSEFVWFLDRYHFSLEI